MSKTKPKHYYTVAIALDYLLYNLYKLGVISDVAYNKAQNRLLTDKHYLKFLSKRRESHEHR